MKSSHRWFTYVRRPSAPENHTIIGALSAIRRKRSSLSRTARSACWRASALANTAASSRSRGISSSGQGRSSRSMPTESVALTAPPTTSGTTTVERVPSRVRHSRSAVASGGRSASRLSATTWPRRTWDTIQGTATPRIDSRSGVTPSRVQECVARTRSDEADSVPTVARSAPRSSTMRRRPIPICWSTSVTGPAANMADRSDSRVSKRRRSARARRTRRRWTRCTRSAVISALCSSRSAAAPMMSPRWRSHRDGSRNRTSVPGGRRRSSSPQRWISRQSTIGRVVSASVGSGRSPDSTRKASRAPVRPWAS